MTPKKKLAYSSLTDKIYWIDGKGQKQDVTQNFIQVMLLWLLEGNEMPKPEQIFERTLKGEKTSWEISYKLK